jgi:hypothetical protein
MTTAMKPKRQQRSRAKGSKLPDGVVCVTRPGKWGNPYESAYDFQRTLELIAASAFNESELAKPVLSHMKRIHDDIEELRGKDLACWCESHVPCHADVLIKWANQQRPR